MAASTRGTKRLGKRSVGKQRLKSEAGALQEKQDRFPFLWQVDFRFPRFHEGRRGNDRGTAPLMHTISISSALASWAEASPS